MRIYEDLRVVQTRLAVLQNALVVVIVLLAGVFWHLQVVRGRYFKTLAENNRSRVVPIAAPRGPLLDRRGRILVENRPSFNIVVRPEHVEDLDDLVRRLSLLLGTGEAQIRERLADRESPFRPVVIRQDAPLQDVAALEARRLEFPDVSVDVVPLRSYPLAAAAAHSLGRVGEIQRPQLQLKEFAAQKPGDLVGQAGVELQYNAALRGRDGSRRQSLRRAAKRRCTRVCGWFPRAVLLHVRPDDGSYLRNGQHDRLLRRAQCHHAGQELRLGHDG